VWSKYGQNEQLCPAPDGGSPATGVPRMSDQAQTRFASEEPQAQRLLSFVTAHLAIFSLLGLVIGVLYSTLFLYGYLGAFDLNLIWIIEYPDILKFGLVASALISSVIFLVHAVAHNLYVAASLHKEKNRLRFIGLIVTLLVIVGLGIYIVVTTTPPEILESARLSALLLIANSLLIWSLVESRRPSILFISFVFFALTMSVGVFGGTLGAYTKYSKGGLTHDVFLKDRQMSNVRLVLFTSHHTVLYAGTDVVVLPTSEIMKIVAHPPAQQHWPDSELY